MYELRSTSAAYYWLIKDVHQLVELVIGSPLSEYVTELCNFISFKKPLCIEKNKYFCLIFSIEKWQKKPSNQDF